tara:strand:- start:532 stop:822 length:291 start_codon:yes stop_codon:yes gene_type:complete
MVRVVIKKSTNPKKKHMAIFYEGDKKIKTQHFGSAGMSDFTINKDPTRKKLYINRHKKRENWNDYKSAGALSRWILWDKPNKQEAISNYKRKFNLS